MDTIGDILAVKGSSIHRVLPSVTVQHAVDLMNAQNIGSLLIIDEQTLLGIFTERDVLKRVVGKGLDTQTTLVGDVMTRSLITVRRATGLSEAMKLVTTHRCRHLPVVEDSKVLGMVSIGDLTRAMIRHLEHEVESLAMYIGSPFPA
jgi:CBS domain-containing protein